MKIFLSFSTFKCVSSGRQIRTYACRQYFFFFLAVPDGYHVMIQKWKGNSKSKGGELGIVW